MELAKRRHPIACETEGRRETHLERTVPDLLGPVWRRIHCRPMRLLGVAAWPSSAWHTSCFEPQALPGLDSSSNTVRDLSPSLRVLLRCFHGPLRLATPTLGYARTARIVRSKPIRCVAVEQLAKTSTGSLLASSLLVSAPRPARSPTPGS